MFVPLLECALDNCLNVVIGTKLDLIANKGRAVEAADGIRLAQELNPGKDYQAYFETSSLTGDSVNEVFDFIFKTCFADGKRISEQKASESTIRLDSHEKPRKSSCC